jgi:hypothetical protein
LAAASVWLLLAPLSVTAGADGGLAAIPVAQDEPVMYLRYDVEITIEPDGRFLVQETQEIQFNRQ